MILHVDDKGEQRFFITKAFPEMFSPTCRIHKSLAEDFDIKFISFQVSLQRCASMCPHGSSSPPRAVASQRSKGALASRRPRKKRLFQVLVFHLWLEVRKGPVQTLRSSIFLYKNRGAKQGGSYKFAGQHPQTMERSTVRVCVCLGKLTS